VALLIIVGGNLGLSKVADPNGLAFGANLQTIWKAALKHYR